VQSGVSLFSRIFKRESLRKRFTFTCFWISGLCLDITCDTEEARRPRKEGHLDWLHCNDSAIPPARATLSALTAVPRLTLSASRPATNGKPPFEHAMWPRFLVLLIRGRCVETLITAPSENPSRESLADARASRARRQKAVSTIRLALDDGLAVRYTDVKYVDPKVLWEQLQSDRIPGGCS
jgi:hypothetical protein